MKFVIAYQSSLIDNDIDTQIDAGASEIISGHLHLGLCCAIIASCATQKLHPAIFNVMQHCYILLARLVGPPSRAS
jgi:hypothetical protein